MIEYRDGRGPVRHPRRGAYDVALVLVRGALRPGQRRVRPPGRAQRRAAAAGDGVRRPPARRSRDRHLGAERSAAAHLHGRLGSDRSRAGAAALAPAAAWCTPRWPTAPRRPGSCRPGCVRTSRDSSPTTCRADGRRRATGGPAWRRRRVGVVPIASRRYGAARGRPRRRSSDSTCPTRPGCTSSSPRGEVMLGERLLEPGDAARLVDEGGRPVTAESRQPTLPWCLGPFRG